MRISISCSKCGRDFSAPSTFAGRRVKCPDCGTGVRVTGSAAASGDGDEEAAPRSSGTMRARRGGGGPNPKVVVGVIGGIAALVAGAMALQHMPSLEQLSRMTQGSTVVTTPQPPAPVTPTPEPEAKPPEPEPTPEPEPVVQETPKPKKPAKPKRDRALAADEIDSDRGNRLFHNVKSIVLVKAKGSQFNDPKGGIWKRVQARTKVTIEKMGIDFSTAGRAAPDDAALSITLSMQPVKKGTPGTQELLMSAELTCPDPDATGDDAYYATVWRAEDSLGTMSAKAIKTGKLSDSLDQHLTSVYGKFRLAHSRAAKGTKDTATDSTASSEPDAAEFEPVELDSASPDDAEMEALDSEEMETPETDDTESE